MWRSGVVKPSSAGTTAKKWRVKREMDADDMMADILTYSSKLKNAQRANALVCPYLLDVCLCGSGVDYAVAASLRCWLTLAFSSSFLFRA